jgi:hypothetical protein
MVGEFETPMEEHDFFSACKEKMQADGIRHSALRKTDKKKWQFWAVLEVML